MDTVLAIRKQAKAALKRIVLPEYDESRTVEAAKIIQGEGLAQVVLLSPDKIDPKDKARYIQEYLEMRKAKAPDESEVKELFNDTLYSAAMMVREGRFDGFVAGASHTTADMARCALRCLDLDERMTIAASSFIMVVPNSQYGDDGTFVFADCGIVPEPNARQLACIALEAAELAHKVLGLTARVVFLSYSTKGSAKGKGIDKIREALGLLKEMAPDILADGEMQVDSAIVPEVARIKYPDSPIQGRANVLIFPNLEAGNIGYKLVERLAGARAIGPLFMGFTRPCSDLSRGCSVGDIVNCVAVTAIRAQ